MSFTKLCKLMSDQENSFFPEGITDLASYVDGIPLPPAIKKSLLKSIESLITGAIDVPVAYFEAKSQKIRTEANALSLVTKKAGEAAALKFGNDEKLIERTVNHFGQKLLKEQINREIIVAKAINELKDEPPKKDSSNEIDEDWLSMFSRIAEQKSNEDIQLFLSKILAGEIRKPGSFSPQSINILSLLSQYTAQLFQKLCNISFSFNNMREYVCVIVEPFGDPGNNALSPVGFSYSNLAKLQNAGLIHTELNAWKEFSPTLFNFKFGLGGNFYTTKPIETLDHDLKKIKIINFTEAGLEIRSVLALGANETYENRFFEWLENKHQLVR